MGLFCLSQEEQENELPQAYVTCLAHLAVWFLNILLKKNKQDQGNWGNQLMLVCLRFSLL